jgi:hypothetical protein
MHNVKNNAQVNTPNTSAPAQATQKSKIPKRMWPRACGREQRKQAKF